MRVEEFGFRSQAGVQGSWLWEPGIWDLGVKLQGSCRIKCLVIKTCVMLVAWVLATSGFLRYHTTRNRPMRQTYTCIPQTLRGAA